MIQFKLEDVNEQPLHAMASELGIPSQATKDDVIREIRKRVGEGNGVLRLVPHKWEKNKLLPPVLMAVAAIAAAASAGFAYWNIRQAADRDQVARDAEAKVNWQREVVCTMLREAWKDKPNGLSIQDIRNGYVAAAEAEGRIELRKDDLDDHTLKRILMELEHMGLAFLTNEDRYAAQRAYISPRDDIRRTFSNSQATYAIFDLLGQDSHAGKHDLAELGHILTKEVPTMKLGEYHAIMAQSKAMGWILIDGSGKIWPSTKLPPPEPFIRRVQPNQ